MTCAAQPQVPGEGHCDWCSHPYRQAVLRLPRQRVALNATARWLGIPQRTMVDLAAEARKRGCLAPLACPFCPEPTPHGGTCLKRRCQRKKSNEAYEARLERMKQGVKLREGCRGSVKARVPEGVVLPQWPVAVPRPPLQAQSRTRRMRVRVRRVLPPWIPPRLFPIGSLGVAS